MGDISTSQICYIYFCVFICVAFPIVLGGCLFGIGSHTCPNVWTSNKRYTVKTTINVPDVPQQFKISSIAFSNAMNVEYVPTNGQSNPNFQLLVAQGKGCSQLNLNYTATNNCSVLATFNANSFTDQSFDLVDKKTPLTIFANSPCNLKITPIRKRCAMTAAGAIILIITAFSLCFGGGGSGAAKASS